MIAATHLSPAVTIPPALVVAGWLLWYWRQLAAPEVPDSRRRIRRASILLMLVTLPSLVGALSFLDTAAHSNQYVVTWLLVLFSTGLLLAAAAIDMLNTLRLGRRERHRRIIEAAVSLARSARAAKAAGADRQKPPGEAKERGPAP